jgi:hypothetical protein
MRFSWGSVRGSYGGVSSAPILCTSGYGQWMWGKLSSDQQHRAICAVIHRGEWDCREGGDLRLVSGQMVTGNTDNVFCFLSSLPFLPPSHHGSGSDWLLTVIYLLLYTVHCIAGADLPIHMIGKVSWEPKRSRLRSQQAEFVENFFKWKLHCSEYYSAAEI